VAKSKTKNEKRWLSDVAAMGCVVCRNSGYGASPAEVHHSRAGVGKGQKAHYSQTIPLCPLHHRTGGYGIAFHAGPEEFEKRYGSQDDLVKQTVRDVEAMRANTIGGYL
jgi:hypothetical protein